MTAPNQAKQSRIRPLDLLCNLPNDAIINVAEVGRLICRDRETIRRWRKLNAGPRFLCHPVYPNRVEYRLGDVREWILGRRADTNDVFSSTRSRSISPVAQSKSTT